MGKLLTSLEDVQPSKSNFALTSFPNPSKAQAYISFSLPQSAYVQLSISDLTGSQVTPLIQEHLSGGQHLLDVPVKDLPSGLYIYTLKVNGKAVSKRLIVQKN